MTRFTRAKGSKSSNERLPENATSWTVMKEEMQRVQQENQENKNRQEHDKVRQQNYDNFLKQKASEVTTEWADFSDSESTQKKEKKIINGVEKQKTKKEKKEVKTISKKAMLEMLKPDPIIDPEVEKLTSQIDKILDKQKIKSNKINVENNEKSEDNTNIINKMKETTKDKNQKKKRNEKKINNKTNNSEVIQNITKEQVDEDAPAEISAKIEIPTVKVKKQKKKQKVLEIKSVKEEINSRETDTNKKNELENTQTLTKSMKKRLMKKKKREAQKNELKTNTEETSLNTSNSNKGNEKNVRKRKIIDESADKPNKFPRKQQKMKVAKVRDNKEHHRRKPEEGPYKMIFNGVEVEVIKFDGFPVKKEDAERLIELKKQMISKGIPRSEVRRTMQLERRRAEKALTREKKKVCFQCRKAGHMLSECPEINSEQISFSGTGICFKCGSTEHTHFQCKVTRGDDYKFASCFICKEQGHIARQCPDNPKGLYPEGGACKLCGDVTHLKKDCPESIKEKEDNSVSLNTITGENIETLDEGLNKPVAKPIPVKNKVVKF